MQDNAAAQLLRALHSPPARAAEPATQSPGPPARPVSTPAVEIDIVPPDSSNDDLKDGDSRSPSRGSHSSSHSSAAAPDSAEDTTRLSPTSSIKRRLDIRAASSTAGHSNRSGIADPAAAAGAHHPPDDHVSSGFVDARARGVFGQLHP